MSNLIYNLGVLVQSLSRIPGLSFLRGISDILTKIRQVDSDVRQAKGAFEQIRGAVSEKKPEAPSSDRKAG